MSKTRLADPTVTHVSYVKKGANNRKFFFAKSADKPDGKEEFERIVPIYINKADEKMLVYGEVYVPNEGDSHDEYMTAEDIEKAAHEYLEAFRKMDTQHDYKDGSGVPVESYIAPVDFTVGDHKIVKGTWVLVSKANDDTWEAIKKGDITGYSLAGHAKKIPDKDQSKANVTKEEMGLLQKLIKKAFGADVSITKADNKANIASFANRIAVSDAFDGMWKVLDELQMTLRDIISDEAITDKQTAINTVFDEFSTYMKKRFEDVGKKEIAKSVIDFINAEPIAKAGKALSAANMAKVQAAITALQEMVCMMKPEGKEGGNEEVKKEDIQEILKGVIDPLKAEIAEIKKGMQPEEQQENDSDPVQVLKSALSEELAGIKADIQAIKKARGMSNQLEPQPKPVEKSDYDVYAGYRPGGM